jgi:alkanesulfonate monooxygenase SsuD/methylene tetrahydromethanopterin reductase-like flavin-dependent oxidoreductase (luciferase family)
MIATITIERFDTEQEARTAEHAAIHYEKPFWNNHNKKPKGRKRKHNYTQEQIDQIKHIWESEEGPARYKLAAVQEVYPEFKKSEWYRLKERDFKPRPPIRKEQSSE